MEPTCRKQYGIAVAALIASSITWVVVSIGALVSSLLLGLGAIALGIFVVSTGNADGLSVVDSY